MKLVVTVCTRARPAQLRACLDSLRAAAPAQGVTLEIVVVENETAPALAHLHAPDAVPPVHYGHEKRLGVPMARNRSVALALALGADWIAFIDDDETVRPDWLQAMAAAIARGDADVLVGEAVPVYDAPAPDWLGPPRPARIPDGAPLVEAATNNTLVARHVFDAMGLRFDEDIGFGGGSDVELFRRAARQGVRIRWTAAAKVEERWPPVRLTMRWHRHRAYTVQENEARWRLALEGRRAAAPILGACARGFVWGAALWTLGAAVRPAAGRRGRRWLHRGGKKLAEASGALSGLRGRRTDRYRKIDV